MPPDVIYSYMVKLIAVSEVGEIKVFLPFYCAWEGVYIEETYN